MVQVVYHPVGVIYFLILVTLSQLVALLKSSQSSYQGRPHWNQRHLRSHTQLLIPLGLLSCLS
ncbi:uncharacterized protein M421DRAFT_172384 [Didymella exigua CBS 183.55]|uniref:Uncharacterized protein n=1 Tax=Didymella exigua CBS 183.55 TaxID=1150837 RepID=A0A6A5RH72_9PLEO|nr:uncharacterized protein M421DRAFT_172384 [Didymella exigua CBS 183.55]KAF1927665.1 hypothetical protein M421DRAFT_172384 [Didymella exigua CBS 183.55]